MREEQKNEEMAENLEQEKKMWPLDNEGNPLVTEDLKDKIVEVMKKEKYDHKETDKFDDQVNKIIQLFETMGTRHTTMVVGPTGSSRRNNSWGLESARRHGRRRRCGH